ncbi:glycosyltransferase family 39 protein [Butyrivibrio sp. VCB2006]|uniref:glycosyltransferase family 39 protein n=1 Tax=Butyrivibrio sp. VCB2006 TaxID=1280679 RepID=UPI0004272B01|nr:hypothetical protein [Butyrivibrio sp. VCB2006]
MSFNGEKIKNTIGAVLGFIAFIVFIYIIRFAMGNDVWYDEVFSLSFAEHNFSDITALTSRDVHPPLYYCYLKVAESLISKLSGYANIIRVAKIASLIPWAFLFILGITYIRKHFGTLTFGLFMLLITVMPQIPSYYLEIRMYSLALLFITAEILISYQILTNLDKKNNLAWTLFFLIGILTAYTQYYACIAIIGSYIGAFLLLVVLKGQKKADNLVRLVVCSVLSVICYLPWLPVLSSQIANISGKYWIQPLTLRSILGCIKFIILPIVYFGKMPEISAGLLIFALAVLTIFFFMKAKKGDYILIVCCLMPIIIVVVSGFILSALGTPIFVYRYLVPTLGGLWLFVSFMVNKVSDKKLFLLPLIIPMLLVGTLNMMGLRTEEGGKLTNMRASDEALSQIPEGSVIITNFDHVCAVMAYYRPDCKVLLYENEIDKLLPDMLGNIQDNVTDANIVTLIESGNENVYFWGSFNSREEIVASWESLGINNKLLHNILIERYWINVYKLSGV